jgi:hypothetical protein
MAMTRTLSLSAVIAFLAVLPQLRAGDPPSGPSPAAEKPRPAPAADAALKATADRFRSVRIVRDLAAFNILNLSSQKEGAWMVAGIHSARSDAYNQGYYIEAETGKVIDRGIRPAVVMQVGGQWKRLESLSGEAPREGRYRWQYPYRELSWDRSVSLYDWGSVFEGPDVTVICRFFEKKSGAEQFLSATAIPDDWKTFVQPAYEHHVRHWADFADSDLNGLRKTASGENPFIALTAIRHLLSRTTTAEERDRLVDLAHSLPKYRQAVLTHWLLKRNADDARDILRLHSNPEDALPKLKRNDDQVRDILLKAIGRSKNAAALPGMALGIESWTATQGRDTSFMKPAMHLREKLVERWRSFERSTAAEEPWKSWEKILIAPGVPEGKSTQSSAGRGGSGNGPAGWLTRTRSTGIPPAERHSRA